MPKLGVGLNLSVPRIGAAAPSGIPISTTNLIINFGVGDPRNGTYQKSVGLNTWRDTFFDGDYQIHAPNAFFDNATWIYFDSNISEQQPPTNPSTDPNYIPTTGWSPSTTITAA